MTITDFDTLVKNNNIGECGWANATTTFSTILTTDTNASNPMIYGTYGATGVYDPNQNADIRKELEELKKLFFMKVVVKCPACGQFGAAGAECKYCGHPIDYAQPDPEKELNSLIARELARTMAAK